MGNKHRTGFTIIEVVLFIGISGFLIIGLIVGTSATIARQRYNDSVQDLAEYFRREYSAVINPEHSCSTLDSSDPTNPNKCADRIDQSICDSEVVSGTTSDIDGPNRGRSGCLLYGRLIVIGENVDGADPNLIWSYDVIGRELNEDELSLTANAKILSSLKTAKITPLARTDVATATNCTYQPIGSYRYSPQWLARVEKTDSSTLADLSILIVRSPTNGSVHTLVIKDYAINVQASAGDTCSSNVATSLLTERIDNPALPSDFQFQLAEADICVGSEDVFAMSGIRRNVRLARDGHNASAVELIDQDSVYDENENPRGNRCAN